MELGGMEVIKFQYSPLLGFPTIIKQYPTTVTVTATGKSIFLVSSSNKLVSHSLTVVIRS
jgi:hypothetical protein